MSNAGKALLFAAVVGWALPARADERVRDYTASLTCGRSTLTVKTRLWLHPDLPLRWLGQTLTLSREGERGARVLPLEGRPRARIASGQTGLDAVVNSWVCVTSDQGVNLLLLGYACGAQDRERYCGGEEEWFRILDEHGRRLDAGFSRQDRRYDALHETLGVSKMMADGVRMSSVTLD